MGQSYFESNMEGTNFIVEMHLSGRTYEIEHFSTEFDQQTEEGTLEPKDDIKGGVMKLTMVQIPDNELLQWAASKSERKNGEIVFMNEDFSPLLRIEFQDAACVDFTQSCNEAVGGVINLTIVPRVVSYDGTTLEKSWHD